jgi:hypothetical protein
MPPDIIKWRFFIPKLNAFPILFIWQRLWNA